MKKILGIAFLICPLILSAADKKIGTDKQWGLTFNFKNLLLSIEEYNDGYQAGGGIRYRFDDFLVLRGLVSFDLQSANDVTTWNMGIAPALEFHFLKGMISPYAAVLAGLRMRFNTDIFLDIYFGGSFGVEIIFLPYLAVFAEYNLLFTIDSNGFGIALAAGNGAQLGLTFYF